ncbi:hypothetical protein M2347_003764 [Chryseobacterium sp. H1D6B]|uniref:hypothetical protein n=1 Tax=Chryseobacterium sp. H1D6B TaxID=2940588 RepID=UPI0015CBB69E|nr:hypothetical protein [Chryseobacterium sp. H1D6B]MDH6254037.1 hypothetical protein [Chryseobacterium sp. H1D6B]
MKKIILGVALTATELISAKNSEKVNPKEVSKKEAVKNEESKKSESESKMTCMSVGILIPCTDEVITDTVCWGEGSGTDTYAQAHADHIRNAQLLTQFLCP